MGSMDAMVIPYICVRSGIGSSIVGASVAAVFAGPVLFLHPLVR